ncbi:malonyl CoA-acyl carrier protein transacylase [Dictyobacter alpinus]|uniref:Malonyl CoA-acyl carrier protein transacylase n=1 Tax=Dictyobacter alpinus TaxID=2014873 RepID=A0A402B728_9CHLR|nr:ACP S-malonyltransferase [Dictyobacter alpinus]GCE27158.1 malonyl CoA-acyl carrier protein transacylase [Dictyobacter alpinus]
MTTQVAFLFPGQGSQNVGMGADVFAASTAARHVFNTFDETLGFSLSNLCFQGPEETLRSTINAQPAIVAVSLAYLAAFQEALSPQNSSWSTPLIPSYTAGHSVGECTALVAAGAIDVPGVAYLVRERGRLMHEEEERCPGGMAAIIGMDAEALQEICQEVSQQHHNDTGNTEQHPGFGQVVLANYNAPGQIVISGEQHALEAACALARDRGAKRAIPLSVSGAFHSPVMQPAAAKLAASIAATQIQTAAHPIISNISALPMTDASDIRQELAQQIAESVQWIRTIEYLAAQGVNTFFEIGPGQALAGMIKRIVKGATIINIGSVADIDKAVVKVQDLGLLA